MKKNILFALFLLLNLPIRQAGLNLIFILFLSLNLLLNLSCSTTEPPIPPDETKPTLTLELDDTSCTEAWLQLTTKDLELPAELTLKQYNPTGDSLSQIFILNTQDSLLYIDSLLPNQTYKFKVVSNTTCNPQPTTNEVELTTMDTTSHNFTFTSWTFGTIGSSTLYDVAIINENNIWAVGEIMIADTSQNGYTTYNAVHWDGSVWELKQIPYYYNGQAYYHPIQAVFEFNESDIWFCGNGVINWDGTNFRSVGITSGVWGPYQMNKMWGSGNSNFYIVGNNGSIAHYNGTSWQRIESGTTLNINDIWGDFNHKTQEWEILAVASNVNSSVERVLIKIKNNSSQIISTSPIQWSLKTCWFIPFRKYYVAGSGLYEKHNLILDQWTNEPLEITTYYTNRIRGNDINDVIGVGAFGDLVHFNGWHWKVDYTEPTLNFGSYLSVDFKNEIVVAVGLEYNQAVILIGIR
jgi:hypothetical protein